MGGNTEDYLDSLLNSINSSGRTRGRDADSPMEDAEEAFRRFEREQEYKREQRRRREEESRRERAFLEEFEDELEEEDADDFLQQYELELEAERAGGEDLFDDAEPVRDSQKQETAPKREPEPSVRPEPIAEPEPEPISEIAPEPDVEPEPEGFPEIPQEEEIDLNPLAGEEPTQEEESSKGAEYAVEETADGSQGDADLLSLLSGLDDDDDELSGLDSLLEAGQELDAKEDAEPLIDDKEEKEDADSGKKSKKKNKKEKSGEKTGFLGKLSTMFFGEEEEEDERSQEELEAAEKALKEEKKKAKAEKKEEKKKTKEEKKEEKAEKKKEKQERKETKKKQKPPKPPKEADNTPPLPKKPVILIFLLTFSLLAFVLLIMKTASYSNQIRLAEQALDEGNYVNAYEDLSGLELKEKDKELYKKANVLALVQSQYNAYLTLMSANEYDMALDALIRGIKHYDAGIEEAKGYGREREMNELFEKLKQALDNQFGISVEQARELYAIRDREEYSRQIMDIINKMNIGQSENDSDH